MSPSLHFSILAASVVVGSRFGGLGLGIAGIAGLMLFVLGFGMPPADPPLKIVVIILSVVTAASAVEAAGGTRYLIRRAEQRLKRHPAWIAFSAPALAFLATTLCGTGYVCLPLFPVIGEVAAAGGIPPERPLSSSLIAIQQGITASPLSAATVTLVVLLTPYGINWLDIVVVALPASAIGTLVAMASVARRVPRSTTPIPSLASSQKNEASESVQGRRAVLIFTVVVGAVACVGALESWTQTGALSDTRPHSTTWLAIMMLVGAAAIVSICQVSPSCLMQTSVFRTGSLGAFSVFGVAWMSETVIGYHHLELVRWAGTWTSYQLCIFAIVLFAASALLFSQAAAVAAIVPIGLALGIPPAAIIAVFTACTGYFLIPSGSLTLACASADPTGGTRIGRYLFDHSFLRPGLCAVVASVLGGVVIQRLLAA